MQRLIVQILKKFLHEGYDDHQTEIMYSSPFTVLMSGGVYQMGFSDWDQANPPPDEDILVRPLARELIATIRGIKDVNLYIIPSRERVARILMDVVPNIFKDQSEKTWWAEHHADYVIEELRRIRPRVFINKKGEVSTL